MFRLPTALLAFSLAVILSRQQTFGQKTENTGSAVGELKIQPWLPQPLAPEDALRAFQIERGLRIGLVAAEPLVEAPVAISFDDQGRLYVVEMRGYMRDAAGSSERDPIGRIKLLEDTDGDGCMDRASVFLDGLVMPRSVMAVKGGVLVAVPPNLFFCKDTDGDGKADVKETIADDYGKTDGRVEQLPNTPIWGMDNAVWSAGYPVSFRLRAGVWQRGPGLGRGQWGLCQDDYGRLFYNDDTHILRCDLLPAEALARNPLLRAPLSVNTLLVTNQSVWPSHLTPGVNEGGAPGTLRPNGTLSRATAACGVVIYRGNALGPDFNGNAFVPEPAGNLVKRLRLIEKDGSITAENVAEGREFLTSTDERFRPVQAANGPDGALYIVDMYRGVIQHASSMTPYLRATIQDRKLEQPPDRGRIWRVVPAVAEKVLKPVRIPTDTVSRVAMLKDGNGWVRDTVQRLLVESTDPAAAQPLADLLRSKDAPPLARLHALWSLDGIDALTPDLVLVALRDHDDQVRAAAVRLAPSAIVPELLPVTVDTSPVVLAHLAIKLSSLILPDADAALVNLVAFRGDVPTAREGALTGLRGREAAFAQMLAGQSGAEHAAQVTPVFEALAAMVAMGNKAHSFDSLLALAADRPADDPVRLALLKGLAGQSKALGDSPVPGKLLWLDAESASLSKLRTEAAQNDPAASYLAAIEKRLAWPGKPGAPPPPEIVRLTEEQLAMLEEGREVYGELCAACHQPHGSGLDGLAPPLVDSEWVLGNPETLVRIVMHGVAGPLKVGSRTWNLAMPPQPQLNDEELADVLTFIRREWEHDATPVSLELVQELRAKYKGRTAMWTADELGQLK